MIHKQICSTGDRPLIKGTALLTNSLLNKGMAFSEYERDAFGVRGLLPPKVLTIEQQTDRALLNFRRKTSDLEKYIYLSMLQQRNEVLFYHLLNLHLEEMMPIIYTPTVGQACLEYGSIYRSPRGLYLSIEDRGRVREIMRHWPNTGVRIIVATDGERILGLGDLGAYGMGICVGKLALYTACAGLHPYYCLPISLDVGTDNKSLLEAPFYIGLNRPRVRGGEYDEFITEFMESVAEVFPDCLLQFEDFGNSNAFRILKKWRHEACSFNDDIQGTAAVALAGLLGALRTSGSKAEEQRILFMGAGEAGLGIAQLFVQHLVSLGIHVDQARKTCWFVDSKGLVVASRSHELIEHKLEFAHQAEGCTGLAEAIRAVRPTALIGVAGAGPVFTQEIVSLMAEMNQHPIIFALSNPTSKAECTSRDAVEWSGGRCIYASGSPMPEVVYDGRRIIPGQGNNVYIFPGVGLGVLVSQARTVTDSMFLAASRTLAKMVTAEEISEGRVYPCLSRIREVSLRIATAVAKIAFREQLTLLPEPANLEADIAMRMFQAEYAEYF